MTISCPNYTQIPNALLGDIEKGNRPNPGLMADMKGSELKVFLVICRLTVGYHQKSRRASLQLIMKFTGLTRMAVHTAAKELEEKKLIFRSQDGGVTLWELTMEEDQSGEETTMETEETKTVMSTNDIKNIQGGYNNYTGGSIKNIPPSKKETKKEINKNITGQSEKVKKREKKAPTQKQQENWAMFGALAKVCQYDLEVITQKQKGALNQAGAVMRQKGYCPDDILGFEVWWYDNHWKGLKDQPPRLSDIRNEWGSYKQGKNGGTKNGKYKRSPQNTQTSHQQPELETQGSWIARRRHKRQPVSASGQQAH